MIGDDLALTKAGFILKGYILLNVSVQLITVLR